MFKNEMKKTRAQMCMTQEEFSERLKISLQTVKKWEQGQTLPNFDNWAQIIKLMALENVANKKLIDDYENEKGAKYDKERSTKRP